MSEFGNGQTAFSLSQEIVSWRKAIGIIGVLGLATISSPANSGVTYVVGSDFGGNLNERLVQLDILRQYGVRVEIRGQVCYSTCTMLLGLTNICVDPDTIFGFHGPSQNGLLMEKQSFDYFSRLISEYYPEPLKAWFMQKGRNQIAGMHYVKGSDIIGMGIPACLSDVSANGSK